MLHRFKETGPGGYDYGNAHMLQDELRDKELFQGDFWPIAKEILAGSFVISSGRQYAQLCDMLIAAALTKEMNIPVDWEVFHSPETAEAVRHWELPRSHTGRPKHTEGLVPGVHEFWWRMLGDAFHFQYDETFELPDKHAIIERFRACGLAHGQTSSTTTEELASLSEAITDSRAAKNENSDERAMRSLQWHLLASLHWLSHKRPRTDRGDVHAIRWRDAMLDAASRPEDQRSLYDHLLIKQVDALDSLLSKSLDELEATPRLKYTRALYDEVIDLYNQKHPNEPIAALHRDRASQAFTSLGELRPILGVVGLNAANTLE